MPGSLPDAPLQPAPEQAPLARSRRELLPDALRGFALFGILVVNIMSFSRGLEGSSLGNLAADSSGLDRATLWLVAFLAEYKFYPLFSFLFGYGFAMQWRRVARGAGEREANRIFARRLQFLALVGVTHGIFIWFGDILARYAAVSLFLRHYGAASPRQVLRALGRWFVVAAGVAVLFAVLNSPWFDPGTDTPQAQSAADTAHALEVRELYSHGDYVDVTRQRARDYAIVMAGIIPFVPQIMVLFLAGMLAARLGWLRNVALHRARWRAILRWGLLLGIPLNLGWAALQYSRAAGEPGNTDMLLPLFDFLIPVLAGAYMAAIALWSERPSSKAWLQLFAAAGRMPMTNYLMQSVVCSFLLYGYGLGLGADLGHAALFGLALAIYAGQLVFSVWYQHSHVAGPMERLWRRYVYRA